MLINKPNKQKHYLKTNNKSLVTNKDTATKTFDTKIPK